MDSSPAAPPVTRSKSIPILSKPIATSIIVVVAALGVWAIWKLPIVEDITQLLPQAEQGANSTFEIGREFGLMNNVAILVGPLAAGDDTLHRAVQLLEGELNGLAGVSSVGSGSFQHGAAQTSETIIGKSPRLYRPELSPIDEPLARARLKALRQRLAAPESIAMGSLYLRDPLGLSNDALRSLGIAKDAIGAVMEQGHVLSHDRTKALVTCQLNFSPMEIARSETFLAELEGAILRVKRELAPTTVQFEALGGVHFSTSSARAMRRDIALAFGITGLGMLAVFLFFFRRLRVLPAALLPGGIGIALAAFVMSVTGFELHALTIGFAATIAGISVDYSIHLLFAGLVDPEATSRERIKTALRSIWRPATSACLTTLAAFVLISTSGFPGIRQLAIFSSIAIPTALLATIFVLPAFHNFILGSGRPPRVINLNPAHQRPAIVIVVAIALLAAAVVGGGRLAISGDPRDLGPRIPDIEERQAKLSAAFHGVTNPLLLVASGGDLQSTLETNDVLYSQLIKDGIPKEDIVSLSPLVPALKTQQESLIETAKLYDGRLQKAFVDSGYTAEYYRQLKNGLDTRPVLPETYRDTPFDKLIASSVKTSKDGSLVLTRVRMQSEATVESLITLVEKIPGVQIISERLRTKNALSRLQRELLIMLSVWLIVSMIVLGLLQRSILSGLKAALPAIIGVTSAVGVVGLLGRPLTPVATAGITLVLGLGIDYGIFALEGAKRSGQIIRSAIFASAITTAAAFGGLSMAQTRAMSDMGIIILAGITGATLAALFVLPLLSRKQTYVQNS